MLLEARDLKKHYPTRNGVVKAVDGVSFTLEPGKTFALVGESGCGKSTMAKLMLLLERPTSGAVVYDGQEVTAMRGRALRRFRRDVQAVFQDPYASLNPRLRVGKIIAEPMMAQGDLDRGAIRKRVAEALDVVGLQPDAARLYPHEFSGGQRQRIAVARALAVRPKVVILDEPTSALDVSIRAQILNLLSDIQDEYGLSYLIIAHDLALVEHFSDVTGVMYLGNMVEQGPTASIFDTPSHPYTQALLASAPRPDPDHHLPTDVIIGEIGSALAVPSGCPFHPRCPKRFAPCDSENPERRATAPGTWARCHLLHGPDTAPGHPELHLSERTRS
ncbi:ATP-binding cassette domain-containing protein [Aquicoccus porphyridii]|uniref:ATP-binding cassette domain-containing protein n=1 Tax=Aquicoccus porphyridii TaxID=1852029 RepID=A0A5A9ZH44_9RHOB|nr:oligopeptide/dipeptide ABC transporter ATP-binding protein [Aquicoccus porphyridii]KAA0916295.1 ATP-binding cassette domain-containing protein [Aquicoccus porphyridii]RAI53578.1 peptide ABC transporter substrate-binding protein [Rhodobacteraceae bacterium AsT-22]